jgi:hypothetical protein
MRCSSLGQIKNSPSFAGHLGPLGRLGPGNKTHDCGSWENAHRGNVAADNHCKTAAEVKVVVLFDHIEPCCHWAVLQDRESYLLNIDGDSVRNGHLHGAELVATVARHSRKYRQNFPLSILDQNLQFLVKYGHGRNISPVALLGSWFLEAVRNIETGAEAEGWVGSSTLPRSRVYGRKPAVHAEAHRDWEIFRRQQ